MPSCTIGPEMRLKRYRRQIRPLVICETVGRDFKCRQPFHQGVVYGNPTYNPVVTQNLLRSYTIRRSSTIMPPR
jgi:hypothetical protein